MVSIAAAIFDLDETLLDTSTVRHAREQREWRAVYGNLAAVRPFRSSRFGEMEVTGLVEQARTRGLKVGLLTQGPSRYASELLRRHGIRVDAMVSGSDGYPPKPDPAGLSVVAAGLGVQARESVYIGDDASDFYAAAAAGMSSVGVAWSGNTPAGWQHVWPDIAIDRPASLLRYLDGDRGLGPLGEILAWRSTPSIHWGSVLRLGAGRYALGRYFPSPDPRSARHALSRLILEAKSEPSADLKVAEIFDALGALIPVRRRPELIVSVPPAPEDARDRFAVARAALASRCRARDGGGVLQMSRGIDDYKKAPRGARAALNVDRFAARALSGERALLIDDVLTSGSQSDACREALRHAGCGPVTVLTLAVTQDHLPEPCPSCGSSLVKRMRRSDGSLFFGCTNYPRCHYTHPLVSRKRAQSISANGDERSS